MRAIKFRGKRLDNGEWTYGGYYHTFTNKCNGERLHMHCIHETKDYGNSIGYCITSHIVDPETVGQYISLKDKNGKEIYSGDLIKTDSKEIAVVKHGYFTCAYSNETRVGFYSDYVNEKANLYQFTNNMFYHSYTSEVVGNIYENPELIEYWRGRNE